MARQPESHVITVGAHEVSVSNPQKVLFPDAGITKLDLVQYYLTVADGALRAAGGRPNVLVRYPNGIGGDFFYQKRAPDSRPPWIEVTTLRFPSGRTAEEVVPRDAASLAWMANLACLELHPHLVRTEDLDHPDELRVDLDPVPGVEWPQVRQVAQVVRSVLSDFGLIGWPKTSGSRGMHIYVRIHPRWPFDIVRRAALALAREVERRAPSLATSKWWKEERHGVFLDYNQNAKDRTVAAAYSVRPRPDARVSAPLMWDEIDACEPADFTLRTMPARFADGGDRHAGIDDHPCSLESLIALIDRHAAEGLGDAPWPPHYRKQEGEPPRVAPSRKRTVGGTTRTRSRSRAGADAGTATGNDLKSGTDGGGDGGGHGETAAKSRPSTSIRTRSGTGRRVSTRPLIEIGRSRKKDEALAGLERWRARHPEASAHMEAADVLVDSMRGRFKTWTRIRVNLQHVPDHLRPAQEALDPDEDINDWSGVSDPDWKPRRPSRARKES